MAQSAGQVDGRVAPAARLRGRRRWSRRGPGAVAGGCSASQLLTAQIIQIGLKDQLAIPKSPSQRKPYNSPESSGRFPCPLSILGFLDRGFERLETIQSGG